MALATLSIDLVAKIAELQAGMDKAGRLSEKTAADIERRFSGLKSTFVGLGGVVAGVFSGGVAAQAVRVLVDGLDALNDAADATGASIGNLSALEDIARRTGTPFETATDAVVKLNKALAEAKPGSDQAKALEAIGLSAETLRKEDPAQALLQVSIALAGFENNGAKARLASELLGRSYAQLAPLLNDLAEKGVLNATVTAEQARQAELFNKQLAGISKNAVDAARSIGGPLISAINEFFDAINGKGPGSLISGLAVPLQTVMVLGANVAFVFRGIGNEIGGLAAQAVALGKLDFKGFTAIGAAMREDAKASREEFDKLERRLLQVGSVDQANFSNEGRNRRGSRFLADLPSARPAGAAALGNEAERYLQTLQQQIDKTGELTVFEQALQRIRRGDLTFTAEITSKRLLDIAAEVDATKEATRISSERSAARIADYAAATDAAKANEAAQRDLLRSLLQATPTGQLEQVTREIEFLNQQFDAGNITSIEQWAEAIRNATGRLGKDTEVKIEGLSEFAEQASRNIQDALGSTITATLKGDFDSIEKLWGNMLLSLASQAIAADIGKALFGSGGGGGGGWISALAGFFGFAKGGAFGAGGAPITAFANGGVLNGSTPFTFGGGRLGVAGEAGPEAIMPLRRGSNGRLGVEMAGGGAGGNTTVINVAAGVNRGEVVSAIQLAMQSVKGEIYGFLQQRRVI